MLNPNLNMQALAKDFAVDRRLMVRQFMQNDIAQRMHNACKKDVPYNTNYVLDNKYQSKTPAEMAKLTPQEGQAINQNILSAASQGVGYVYHGYLKSRALTQVNTELAFLHDIFDYFSSDEVLDVIKKITGDDGITGAEPQYTRYKPGHFLTRHIDIIPGRGRRYAFVLGLTQAWHPDWGGLLQFFEKNGTPRDAWTPQFNVLSLFDVSHVHSVTYVTPFAKEPRLSLTGWFVGKP